MIACGKNRSKPVDAFVDLRARWRSAENGEFLLRFSSPKLTVSEDRHCYTFESFAGESKIFRTVPLPPLQTRETRFLKEETWS